MFKSIRWKITVIFVLLVLATELFIGGFNIFRRYETLSR